MKTTIKLLCSLGFGITCFYAQLQAIALLPDAPPKQEQDLPELQKPIDQPKSEIQHRTTAQQVTTETKNIINPVHQESEDVKTLLNWFEWAKTYPTNIGEQELTTLRELITRTSTLKVAAQTQNVLATTLVALFDAREQLSLHGKQIFSAITNNRKKVSFLTSAQMDHIEKTMVPALKPPPAPTIKKQPVQIPKMAPIISPKTYVAKIKAAIQLKKASMIMASLITLLDQEGTKQIDAAAISEFTNVLNKLSKQSDQLSPDLRLQFITLLQKALKSNFLAPNQKQYVNALMQSLKAQPRRK